MKKFIPILLSVLFLFACESNEVKEVVEHNSKAESKIGVFDSVLVDKVKHLLIGKFGDENKFRIERGVAQTAQLWQETDGDYKDFEDFCLNNFVSDEAELEDLFSTIQRNQEIINGNFNRMSLELQEPVQLDMGEVSAIENLYAAFNPSSHLTEDFFNNKIAFITALNFPHYSLKEKNTLANRWTQKDWAMARAGDLYTERVPADLIQNFSTINANASNYIDSYNIYMGNLRNDEGKKLFSDDKILITHWNLRDELKSQYAEKDGLEKQMMIYSVMKHIINQTIPNDVINNNKYLWNPNKNELFTDKNEAVTNFKSEPNTRYEHLLNNFKELKSIDEYSPIYDSYVKRKFDKEMELTFDNVEQIFVELLTSDVRMTIADYIKSKLGRDLQPFDIWYKGFKPSSGYSEQELDKITKSKFKNPQDFKKEMPAILKKFGFDDKDADFIASKVIVEPSRGAGHASGAAMRDDVSRLRTRIGAGGMDYKGYNIAVHEFGHNVEQTITMHDVPNYLMSGVPNNAFTEAVAFIFQSRDLHFLSIEEKDAMKKNLYALDNFWSAYEIMGVALVDMYAWKWMYENPDASAEELKTAVVRIAKEVWNKYYADVFGSNDSEILAIYSHIIAYPLYLSAYPLGHLVEFNMEQQFENKNKASELKRIMMQGRMTPEAWMRSAFDIKLSSKPLIDEVKKAIDELKKNEAK